MLFIPSFTEYVPRNVTLGTGVTKALKSVLLLFKSEPLKLNCPIFNFFLNYKIFITKLNVQIVE